MSFKASIEVSTSRAPRPGGVSTTGYNIVSVARVVIDGREPAEFRGHGGDRALTAALDYIRATARAVPLGSEDQDGDGDGDG